MDTTSNDDTLSLHQQLQTEKEKVSKLKVIVIREKKGAAGLKEKLQSTLSDVEAWKIKCISLENRLQEVVDNIPTLNGISGEKERHDLPSDAHDVAVQHYDNKLLVLLDRITHLESELATRITDESVYLQRINYLESQLVEFEVQKDGLRELERVITPSSHESCSVTSENFSCAPTVTTSGEPKYHCECVESSGQLFNTPQKVVDAIPCTTDTCNDQCLEQMTSLEKHVLQLKEFVEDQVERANAQAVEVMQKLKLQAADYDHLVRSKESEIFTLRESCDRLSEEVSMFFNFYSSLIQQYITVSSNLSREIPNDWSIFASQIDISDSLEIRCKLFKALGSFQDHLQNTLNDFVLQTSQVINKVKSHCDIGVDCTSMTEYVEKLDARLVELEQLLSTREYDRNAIQQELVNLREQKQQSEEKIQRMKSLLVKVKCEISENRMTAAKLETLTEENSSLRNTINLLTTERDEIQQAVNRLESECSVAQQQVANIQDFSESVYEERDHAKNELIRLQTEFSAYKLKAFHALRGNGISLADRRSSVVNNHELAVDQVSNGDSQRMESFADTVDKRKALQDELSAAHRRIEEVSLDASLARTECELVRQDLTELRSKCSELTECLSSQKQQWESKVADIAQQRDAVVSSRIKELEKLVATQQAEFQRKIMEEQSRCEQLVREASGQSHLFGEEQEKAHSCQSTLRSGESASQFISNTAPDESFDHRFPLDRLRGDGADYEGPGSPDYQRTLKILPHQSGSCSPNETASLHGQNVGRPKILPLEYLLRETDTAAKETITTPDPLYSPASIEGRSTLLPFASSPVIAPQQVNSLRAALANQQRRVEQLSELLNDSENTVARLIDQSKILKDEIRRLEQQKNTNSSDTAANTKDEYTRLPTALS